MVPGMQWQLQQCVVAAQVDLVSLLSLCMADGARWEEGLRQLEKAMSALPSATHLPLSKWKVPSAPQIFIGQPLNLAGILASVLTGCLAAHRHVAIASLPCRFQIGRELHATLILEML